MRTESRASSRTSCRWFPGTRVFITNPPPINIGGRSSREPLPVHAAGDRHRDAVPLRGDHGAEDARAPGSHRRQQRSADQESAGAGRHRSRPRLVARHHGQLARGRALQRVRFAAGLDHLHAQQSVLGGDGARAAVPEESRRARAALRARRERRSRSVQLARARLARHRTGDGEPLGAAAVGDARRSTCSPASRSAPR